MDYSYSHSQGPEPTFISSVPFGPKCTSSAGRRCQKRDLRSARAVAVSWTRKPPRPIRVLSGGPVLSRLGPKRPATWWLSSIVLHHHQRPGCKFSKIRMTGFCKTDQKKTEPDLPQNHIYIIYILYIYLYHVTCPKTICDVPNIQED